MPGETRWRIRLLTASPAESPWERPAAVAPRSPAPTQPGQTTCNGTFNLAGGQIVIQGVVDTAALFVRNETVPLSIIGGTGMYENARGVGTVQLVAGVPNLADANFVLNLTG
jgi:hypothetical protein